MEVAPEYPAIAAHVVPAPIVGVIIFEVTLAEDGHPTDIKVLHGVPLLDKAAIDAVIAWRYKPTLVNDDPRRVVLREVVDMFPDADAENCATVEVGDGDDRFRGHRRQWLMR
ncbi:MAG TPA: energy transducer TonB [Vicinamibacteria bacterium]|nr:energy transducer TonB [Vicinamibacteria bacterium]